MQFLGLLDYASRLKSRGRCDFVTRPVYGRIVFAASAVLSGVLALMWRDAATWQASYKLLSLPLGAVVGTCVMIAQIAGGLCLFFPRTLRAGSTALTAVYAIFSLTCIPAIATMPAVYESYGAFFEQFALLCGAVAMLSATGAGATRACAFRLIARIGLGLCAISFAVAQIVYLAVTAQLVPVWIPPNQVFWANLTTIAFALAAIALLIDRQAVLAARLMALMLGIFGFLVWVPRLLVHPESHFNWSEFALNFLIAGATYVVADALNSSVSRSTTNMGSPKASVDTI